MERYVNVTGMGVYYRRRIVLPCRFMIVDFSWSLVTVCPKFACSLYRTFIQNMLTVTFAHCIYSMPQLVLFLGLERCSTYSRVTTVWEWRLLTLVNIHCPHMMNMTSQVDKVFCVDSIVHRYHVYKTVWAAFGGRSWLLPESPRTTMTGMLCMWRRMERLSATYCRSYYHHEILQIFPLLLLLANCGGHSGAASLFVKCSVNSTAATIWLQHLFE